MTIFIGNADNNAITPATVSPGVLRNPLDGPNPSAAADILYGGGGNDVLNGGGGADQSFGGSGNDTILAVIGIDIADGGSGNDTLITTLFSGDYVVNLATGLTNFSGESFINFENLYVGTGNDSVTGTADTNRLFGGDGDDTLNGAGGDDNQFGGSGDDLVFASLGLDIADGGTGTDTLDTTSYGDDYAVNLATGLTNFAGESYVNFENLIAGDGNDTLTGTTGVNRIDGGAGDDAIFGGGGSDTLTGSTGNDRLVGNADSDTLRGGAGADTLQGGSGSDRLSGGTGSDTFLFAGVSGSPPFASDRIAAGDHAAAFDGAGAAAGDIIDLSGIDARAGIAGNQAFGFGGFGAGRLRVVEDGAGNSLVLGNTDGDAVNEFRLVIEDAGVLAAAYTAADFVL